MEDQEDGLVLLGSNGVLDVLLVLAEKLWVELDVTRLVNTVNVAKTSGNGEVWGDRLEGLVDGKDVLGLGVEGVVVDILVVDTILLAASNTDFLKRVLANSIVHVPFYNWRPTISSHCFIGAARFKY